jgi:glycosyltransferase involved in cell wall biosynthesis
MTFEASIIIPLLNQVDGWLEQSVRSAVTQNIPTEVVVVRSKFTSPLNQMVLKNLQRQYNNLAILVEEKSAHHFPAAINMGIRHTTTNRVGLLFSDDWLDPGTIAECLPRETDIVSTGTVVYFPNGSVNERACRTPSILEFNSCDSLEKKASYLTHFFLLRKELVLSAGGLDESIGNCPGIDDFDLIWTLLEYGATVSVIGKGLYHVRDHEGDRLTLQNPKMQVENLKKILHKHGITDEQAIEIINKHAHWYGKPIFKVTLPGLN